MKHPTALTWFRFHAADLSAWAWLRFQIHTWLCSVCRERLRADQLDRRLFEGTRPHRWQYWALAPIALAGAVVFLLVGPLSLPEDDLRAKGGSRFDILTIDNGAAGRPLSSHCSPGERLQAIVDSERSHLLIVEVGPEGKAQILFPLDGDKSARIPSRRFSLPQSWTLDDTSVGRERFIALFSDFSIEAAQAKELARGDRSLGNVDIVERACLKEKK